MKNKTFYPLHSEIQSKHQSNSLFYVITTIIVIFFLFIINVYKARTVIAEKDDRKGTFNHETVEKAKSNPFIPCVQISSGEYDCTDEATKEIIKQKESSKKIIKAIRTKYSREDSCHNPRWKNGKKECLTAIGRDTKEGVTVACPRNIKLGTKVMIEGKTYTCEDRYSAYLDKKRNLPTFDVFAEGHNLHKLPDYKLVEVVIL